MLKFAISLLGALCLWLVAPESRAACTATGPTVENNIVVLIIPPFTISNINPNAMDGAVLHTLSTMADATRAFVSCGIHSPLQHRGTTGAHAGGIYPTGISGIGMRLSYGASFTPWPYSEPISQSQLWVGGDPNGVGQSIQIQFIKTGPITAGGMLHGEFGGIFAENGATQIVSYRFKEGNITPSVPTCTVTSPSIQVDMQSVPVESFSGVGSYGGTQQQFDISLLCSGGANGSSTKIYITLTDQTNPGNTSDMLSLTTASNATGVKIKLFGSSGPVSFGPDSSAAGNTNQWFVTQTGSGSVTIPLTARYVQTESTVSPGSANAVATFTMSYQ